MAHIDTQKEVFLAEEGDKWFGRNLAGLAESSPVRDLATSVLAPHLPSHYRARVLEIGCGRGDNLAALHRAKAIEGYGIDPSAQAVGAGQQLFPSFRLRQGTADALPFADGEMEAVWFGFCLYLVDRPLLMRAVAEADRVLQDGGLLMILDFDPGVPTARKYHHREGVRSYKMDYSELFLANPAYKLVDKRSASHVGPHWAEEPQERIGIWLCAKRSASAYLEV